MDAALLAGLYLLALALRLVPLTFSTLPYNIDGFPLAKIAEGMAATGSWRLDEADVNSYNLKMPGFPLIWSALLQLGGLDPLRDLSWALPLVTSTLVLPGYLLGLKGTGHRGVGLASALFLAVFGSFLFLTSAIMKEALALVLLPAAILLFHERADPRKRGLALLLLLVLPFFHHLTTLMALGSVAALVVLTHRRAFSRGRFSAGALALDMATGPATAAVVWAYYSAVDLPFFRDVTSLGDLVLILALSVLVAAALAGLSRPARIRLGRPLTTPASRLLVIPAVAVAGLLVNARTPVFAGTAGTKAAFLVLLPAVAVLAAFAFVGYELVRRTANRTDDLVLAFLAAPAAVLVVAFLRGLDPFNFAVMYRAFDFLDFGLAILAAVGLVYLVRRANRWRVASASVAAVFLLSLAATTPMAWDTQAVFGVENVTAPEEFQALAFLASLHPANMTSDQRLANVAEWWFGIPSDASLPFRLERGDPVEGSRYAVVLERWATVGAQVHPAPNLRIEPATLEGFLRENAVLYVAGPSGDRIYVLALSEGGS